MDIETAVRHKFLCDSGMTCQEVFDFAFRTFVPVTLMQGHACCDHRWVWGRPGKWQKAQRRGASR